MSKDIQLTWECPHIILEEVVRLNGYQDLETKMPVANQGFVGVMVNNSLAIPSGGLFTFARLSSFVKGPYYILDNEQDLTIYSSGERVSLTLPAGQLLSIQEVADLINDVSVTINAVSNNEHLQIWDRNIGGGGSYIEVAGGSVTRLGFKQRGATGKMLYPGWHLYTPSDTLTTRFIRFNESLPMKSDTFKVSYVTTPGRCLRCKAIGIENDYRYTGSAHVPEGRTEATVEAGALIMINNEDLLYQTALKLLLTKQGSNPYHPSYGTSILKSVGAKATGAVAAGLTSEIRRALNGLRLFQRKQARYQEITLREQLSDIDTVQVTPVTDDPTMFMVQVWVRNASQQSVQLTVAYATAGSVATVVNMRSGNSIVASGVR